MFRAPDLLIIAGVLVLGLIGYLCDVQSPLVFRFRLLSLIGLFWVAAFLALFLGCIYQAGFHRRKGWTAGLVFGLMQLLFWIAFRLVLAFLPRGPE